MDFICDSVVSDRRLHTIDVKDDCSKEALEIEIYTSLSSKRVKRKLERIIENRGNPAIHRSYNGPEFTSKNLELWCQENEIPLQFIQPRKQMQNGFIERFNRLYRISARFLFFYDLNSVRKLITK